MFKIIKKVKELPLVGTYFRVEQRYYKIHAFDKKASYLHMFGDEFSTGEVSETFGTTMEGWIRRYKEGKYIVISESEVPERILNYKLKKSYAV